MNKLFTFGFKEGSRVYLRIYFMPHLDFEGIRKPGTPVTMLRDRFKVDTGADVTTISKKSLVGFGYT